MTTAKQKLKAASEKRKAERAAKAKKVQEATERQAREKNEPVKADEKRDAPPAPLNPVADRKESKWRDPIITSTVVIALATILNLFISVLLWQATYNSTKVATDTYKAANRPYVGIAGYDINKDDLNKKLIFNVRFRNVGPVPATEFDAELDVKLNGKPLSGEKVPDKPKVLFPQTESHFRAIITGEDYDPVVNGSSILEVTVNIKYKGVQTEQYYTYDKAQYSHKINSFISLEGDAK